MEAFFHKICVIFLGKKNIFMVNARKVENHPLLVLG